MQYNCLKMKLTFVIKKKSYYKVNFKIKKKVVYKTKKAFL